MFDESTLITLQDLQDYFVYSKEGNDAKLRQALQPVELGVTHLPKVWVIDNTVDALCHGTQLAVPGICKYNTGIKEKDTVALMTLKDELVAVGNAAMSSEQIGKESKGIAVRPSAVFMQPGVYPRYKKI